MKSWQQYKVDAGYCDSTPPEVKKTWVAYKAGEVKHFANRFEAQKFSKNIECIEDVNDQKVLMDYLAAKVQVEKVAEAAWDADLRKEHSDLTTELFDLCYARAYEMGHSNGRDEIANMMDDAVDFAKQAINSYLNKH